MVADRVVRCVSAAAFVAVHVVSCVGGAIAMLCVVAGVISVYSNAVNYGIHRIGVTRVVVVDVVVIVTVCVAYADDRSMLVVVVDVAILLHVCGVYAAVGVNYVDFVAVRCVATVTFVVLTMLSAAYVPGVIVVGESVVIIVDGVTVCVAACVCFLIRGCCYSCLVFSGMCVVLLVLTLVS